MSVILIILKIIGIIIAVVIGIVLLVAALVLFYPVGYRINGAIEKTNHVKAELYWLFHILSFQIVYEENKPDISLKLFGFTKKKKEKASALEEELEDAEDEAEDAAPELIKETAELTALSIEPSKGATETQENKEIQERPQESEGAAKQQTEIVPEQKKVSEPQQESVQAQKRTSEKETSEKKAIKKKISGKKASGKKKKSHGKLSDKIKKSRQKVLQLKNNIRQFCKKAGEGWHTIVTDSNKEAILYIGKELIYLLKHMRFRKLKTSLDFSIGDPAVTGQVLGGLAALPFLYQYDVHIYPDFESEAAYLRGTFMIKGHLRLIHVLCSFLRLIFKKECRMLFGYFMK